LNQPIFVQNNERQYHLYLPADSRTAPIVVLLHGNGGSNDQILGLTGTKAPHKVWLDIAQQENIILVVPNGAIGPNDKRGWNDCRTDAPTNPDTDDVRFISELVEFVQNSYGSGTTSVFSVGTSNGGFMSMRLAAEIPDTIDAIAILVASKPVNSECIESVNPVSVLIMNGTNDPILPYYGGQIVSNRGEVFSAAETVNYWINRNQTDLTASVLNIPNTDPDDNSTVIRYSHTNGINNTAVENYIITNGGHTEPSIAERYGNLYKLVVGNQNGDIEMATEVWNFFRSQ
jgi:polyhydroxybutyrate depolymerase